MHTNIRWLFWTIILAAALPAWGQEKFDPAAVAARVAPFLDEQTWLLVRIDTSRIDPHPAFALLEKIVPAAKKELDAQEGMTNGMLASFRQFGGRELDVVVGTAGLAEPATLAIFPIAKDGGADSLAKLAEGFTHGLASQRRGGLLLVGNREAMARLKSPQPAARPDLVRALEAAGDTAIQVVLTPPAYAPRVVEEMMPTLPEVFGGGPSTVLTHGVRWAAAGIDLSPRPSLRLVVQSADAASATAFKAKWGDVARAIGREEDTRRTVPRFDELSRLLTPEAQADRLILSLDADKAIPAIVDLLKPAKDK